MPKDTQKKGKKRKKEEQESLASEEKEGKKKTRRSKKKKEKETEEPKIREIIAVGEDEEEEEDEDAIKAELEKMEKRWWLEEPWRSLLDPELSKNFDFKKYDLSKLIQEFTDRMLQEDLIDFRISGLAIYSSAKMYHWKITDIIKEEEKIEKQKAKERIKREIPKALSQPLREARKLATTEELFSAMRRAIIETMQKREKLRLRRIRREQKKVKTVTRRGKGRLPTEILKHITGSDETIEERLNKWLRKLREIIKMEDVRDKTISMDKIKEIIYSGEGSELEKRVKFIQAFEAMMFLASLNRIRLKQETMRSPIEITVIDSRPVELK